MSIPRSRRLDEDFASSLCHGVGIMAAMVGTPFLIVSAFERGDPAFIVGVVVFCVAMILLYAASTLYHALPPGRIKRVFFALDHSAIFVLIAGTYTPFTLGVLRDSTGWLLFAAVWVLAIVGVGMRAMGLVLHPAVTTALYVAMGWLVLFDLDALMAAVPQAGLLWLVAGGACYTLGVVFFATDRLIPYGHVIWHTFVVAGTVCHYFAVLWYAA